MGKEQDLNLLIKFRVCVKATLITIQLIHILLVMQTYMALLITALTLLTKIHIKIIPNLNNTLAVKYKIISQGKACKIRELTSFSKFRIHFLLNLECND